MLKNLAECNSLRGVHLHRLCQQVDEAVPVTRHQHRHLLLTFHELLVPDQNKRKWLENLKVFVAFFNNVSWQRHPCLLRSFFFLFFLIQADNLARVAGKMSWSSVMVQMTCAVDFLHLRGQNRGNLDNVTSRLSGPHSLYIHAYSRHAGMWSF